MADVFHTFFGLCGLALLGYTELDSGGFEVRCASLLPPRHRLPLHRLPQPFLAALPSPLHSCLPGMNPNCSVRAPTHRLLLNVLRILMMGIDGLLFDGFCDPTHGPADLRRFGLGMQGLRKVDPVYALPVAVLQRMGLPCDYA